MQFNFTLQKKDSKTRARRGIITTPHGQIQTPAFSPVGTKASVKALDPIDLVKTNSQVVLANTYHLYLQPGIDVIKKFNGFGPFMGWNGPTITDSGGYQVSFMWSPEDGATRSQKVKISDSGALFFSHIDGSKHLLTPEKSMQIQAILGADIIMAFDQPMGSQYTKAKNKEAFERTLHWEERSFVAWRSLEDNKKKQAPQTLFGIIQGQANKSLRVECLKFLLNLGFPGLAIGDEEIGIDPARTAASLDTIQDLLPDDKPLHALGLGGGPEGIFEAVQRGVDIFDNTSVTRMARSGLLFIYPEDGGKRENKFRLNVAKAKYADELGPVSKICECYTCRNFSKSYIRHLFVSNEMLGSRLGSIHNITFINDLMSRIRVSIENNDFLALKKEWI